MSVQKLGNGLRYWVPPYRRGVVTLEEIEARARDRGFIDEASHQLWRKNHVLAPLKKEAK